MAKRTVNIGSTANDGTGDQLRTAFDKLNQNNDEIYGANFVTEDMLNDNIVGTDELKVSGVGAAGQILTSNADGTFSWATGVTGDITGVEAGAGLTGGGTGGDVILNVAAGTGITVTADEVALDTTVQDEITVNTGKVGITTAQAADIVTNNAKVSDQTVTLTEGTNVTITGTYPDFTIASDDVVGAVNSVNGDTGVVVLDTADIAENTNLYYTEARVTANTEVTANTAKTGITAQQTSDITANNAKLTDQTVTLTDGGNVTITGTYPDFTLASPDVTGAVTSVNTAVGAVVLDTSDIAEDTNLYYTEARVSANAQVAANTAKTGITSAQAAEIVVNNGKNTDQTVTLTDAGNITIGGTYPDFTIASADVVGAVTSVNGAVGVVALDTADITENTNLYYTEARVAANSAVAANTAKVVITSAQASEIAANTLKTGITTAQAGEITDNNAKLTNATHTGDVTGSGLLTLVDNKVITSKILDLNVTTAKLANDAVTHDKLSARFTAEVAISDLTGAAAYDCSAGSSFKLSGDLTGGAYTINLSNYKKGQVITIYPLKGESATLAAGTGTGVFNKLSEMDYDNTKSNILQIECVDDQAATPVFFYSVASFANDATI